MLLKDDLSSASSFSSPFICVSDRDFFLGGGVVQSQNQKGFGILVFLFSGHSTLPPKQFFSHPNLLGPGVRRFRNQNNTQYLDSNFWVLVLAVWASAMGQEMGDKLAAVVSKTSSSNPLHTDDAVPYVCHFIWMFKEVLTCDIIPPDVLEVACGREPQRANSPRRLYGTITMPFQFRSHYHSLPQKVLEAPTDSPLLAHLLTKLLLPNKAER